MMMFFQVVAGDDRQFIIDTPKRLVKLSQIWMHEHRKCYTFF